MDESQKKDLEATLKEKVAPLVEEIMEKSWGISIPKIEADITDKLKNPLFNLYIPSRCTFGEAKKIFKTEFLKKELSQHLGNVSQLAKSLGVDRRSVHRAIKELELKVKEFRHLSEESGKLQQQQDAVDQTIRSAMEHYRGLLQPKQLEKFYAEIPRLSRNIADALPHQELSWKHAEREFEKQFLAKALEELAWDVSKTAKRLKIRAETLYRKIKRLGIEKGK